MIIAIEDPLSETIARRLLSTYRPRLSVNAVVGLKGQGYLRSKARELNRTAGAIGVLLLTDLDTSYSCPMELIEDWLGAAERHVVLRVAVVEVEAWLLADRAGMAALLAVPQERIPDRPEHLHDPKEVIVNIARRSRAARVRNDFVPTVGSTSRVGPAFTPRLNAFVSQDWNPDAAATQCMSLRRAIQRIRTM